MPREFDCEGAPRDLGFDQGRACGDDLREPFSRSPFWERWKFRLGVDEKRPARLARDLKRYFPQQSEALEGMARASELPLAWFVSQLDRELGIAGGRTPVAAAGVVAVDASRSGGAPVVARTLDCEPVVRYSRPEGGFASVELTLPWFTASLAGVNEGGLAASWIPLPGGFAEKGCAAPAALLIQDCLARFDSIRGAVDWCTGRPCGGRAAILLADAAGEVSLIEVNGRSRRVRAAEAGLVFAGDAKAAATTLAAAAKPDLEMIAKAFGGRVAGIDPVARRVALLDGATGGCEYFELRSPEPVAAERS